MYSALYELNVKLNVMNVIVVILQLKLLRQNIFLLSYKIIVSVKAEYRLNNDSK